MRIRSPLGQRTCYWLLDLALTIYDLESALDPIGTVSKKTNESLNTSFKARRTYCGFTNLGFMSPLFPKIAVRTIERTAKFPEGAKLSSIWLKGAATELGRRRVIWKIQSTNRKEDFASDHVFYHSNAEMAVNVFGHSVAGLLQELPRDLSPAMETLYHIRVLSFLLQSVLFTFDNS